jgi:hypothetical protein
MNIPVELSTSGSQHNSDVCTENAYNSNICERIPIPRPLTKINGQIVARFTGASTSDGETDNLSPSQSTSSPPKQTGFGGPGGDLTNESNSGGYRPKPEGLLYILLGVIVSLPFM